MIIKKYVAFRTQMPAVCGTRVYLNGDGAWTADLSKSYQFEGKAKALNALRAIRDAEDSKKFNYNVAKHSVIKPESVHFEMNAKISIMVGL